MTTRRYKLPTDVDYSDVTEKLSQLYIRRPSVARDIFGKIEKSYSEFQSYCKIQEDQRILRNRKIPRWYRERLQENLQELPDFMVDFYSETSIPEWWAQMSDHVRRAVLDAELEEYMKN